MADSVKIDTDTRLQLASLIRSQRVAALGTLLHGTPLVSLVIYAAASDFGAFYIHISRLAQHTQAILADPRVGLMITEQDEDGDPQTLARLSLRGKAAEIVPASKDYEPAMAAYLAKHPGAAFNLTLRDFSLYRIVPDAARYVGGFGKIFDLAPEDFRKLASGV